MALKTHNFSFCVSELFKCEKKMPLIKFYGVKQSLHAYLEYLTWFSEVYVEISVDFWKIKKIGNV